MKRFKWDFQGHRFTTTKGSSFYQKKISESKPVFHTLRFNISQFAKMSPRLELFLRPWRICQPQVFAFEFSPSDESKLQTKVFWFYNVFLVISIFACRPNQIASYKCTAFSNILSPARLPLEDIFLFMCFCGQELCFFWRIGKRKFLGECQISQTHRAAYQWLSQS